MAPMVVAKSGIFVRFDTSVVMPMPVPTPPRATAMGSPMASTDPNDRINTTIANASPISSESGGSNLASTDPPTSVCRPSTVGSMPTMRAPISPLAF